MLSMDFLQLRFYNSTYSLFLGRLCSLCGCLWRTWCLLRALLLVAAPEHFQVSIDRLTTAFSAEDIVDNDEEAVFELITNLIKVLVAVLG